MNNYYKIPSVSQLNLIEADPLSSYLVNARPGIGKTYVLIHRVCFLIGELNCDCFPADLEESQYFDFYRPEEILILCFAKTTVETIRNRIGHCSSENFLITTFDSFAGKLLYETGNMIKNRSYNESISKLCTLLEQEDPRVLDLISEFQYLLIDEAQDLVDDRLRLVTLLTKYMKGNMIFQDPNQMIFEFSKKKDTSLDLESIVGILPVTLDGKNYRLSKELQELESNLRTNIQNGVTEYNKYLTLLEKYDISKYELDTEIRDIDVLIAKNRYIMYREYYNLIDLGLDVKILEPNSEKMYPCWLGKLFFDFEDDTISKKQFRDRWNSRDIGDRVKMDENWLLLKRVEKSGCNNRREPITRLRKDLIKIDYLLEGLQNPRWIVHFTDMNPGELIISTIHRAKGKEFSEVILALPKKSFQKETMNVVYVGATRASKGFYCKIPDYNIPKYCDSQKKWIRFEKNSICLTFGLMEDHNEMGMFRLVKNSDEFYAKQRLIHQLKKTDELRLFYRRELKSWIIQNSEQVDLQEMSKKFRDDLITIYIDVLNHRRFPYLIRDIRMEKIGTSVLHPHSKERKICKSGIYNVLRIVGSDSIMIRK